MTTWRVVPESNSGDTNTPWRVKKSGSYVRSNGFTTQQKAINYVRRKGKQRDQLYVHGHDGQVRDQYTLQG